MTLLSAEPIKVKPRLYLYHVRCDYEGCRAEFLSAHSYGSHYCPQVHRYQNKLERTREACKRWHEIGPVAGTTLDRRTHKKIPARGRAPHCPKCRESIRGGRLCRCARNTEKIEYTITLIERGYIAPQVATWRPECEPLPLWCKEKDEI